MKFGVLYAFRNPPQWHKPYPDFYRAQFDQMQAVEQLRSPNDSSKNTRARRVTTCSFLCFPVSRMTRCYSRSVSSLKK